MNQGVDGQSKDVNHLALQTIAASFVAAFLILFGFGLTHAGLNEGVFLFVPFCTGLAIAFMSKGKLAVWITTFTSLIFSLGVLVFTGVEGWLCVLMAFPILFIAIGMGTAVGYAIAENIIKDYGNISVIAACVGLMSLAGWATSQRADSELLVVQTSMDFHAPMTRVWDAVTEVGPVEGNAATLRIVGLPVPYHCTLAEDGTRVCYFEQGQMVQKVTVSEYGKSFQIDIVEALHVRDWLTFIDAGYEFIEHDGYVQVIRTDRIKSTLRPRWYWHWFETKCIQLEHRYVMSWMRTKAEQAGGADAPDVSDPHGISASR